MPPKRDINKVGFEEAEFPILCETCLGPSPYLRMTKQEYGAECKTCTRPFTVFRWSPGAGMRFKKTEVCQTCSKMKNVCQTCLLDLQYGLPTQIRDAAMGTLNDGAPKNEISKAYAAQNAEGKLDSNTVSSFGKANPATKELLKRLARSDPNYSRNRPRPCSFFQKGECNRGDACPYRHDIVDTQSPLANQNIQDRFNGVNDPVARKIMAKVAVENNLAIPEDEAITSLFFSNLPDSVTEAQLRFAIPTTASVKSVVLVASTHCAFVNFTDRRSAEDAALKLGLTGVTIEGSDRPSRVQWGRSKKSANPATRVQIAS